MLRRSATKPSLRHRPLRKTWRTLEVVIRVLPLLSRTATLPPPLGRARRRFCSGGRGARWALRHQHGAGFAATDAYARNALARTHGGLTHASSICDCRAHRVGRMRLRWLCGALWRGTGRSDFSDEGQPPTTGRPLTARTRPPPPACPRPPAHRPRSACSAPPPVAATRGLVQVLRCRDRPNRQTNTAARCGRRSRAG